MRTATALTKSRLSHTPSGRVRKGIGEKHLPESPPKPLHPTKSERSLTAGLDLSDESGGAQRRPSTSTRPPLAPSVPSGVDAGIARARGASPDVFPSQSSRRSSTDSHRTGSSLGELEDLEIRLTSDAPHAVIHDKAVVSAVPLKVAMPPVPPVPGPPSGVHPFTRVTPLVRSNSHLCLWPCTCMCRRSTTSSATRGAPLRRCRATTDCRRDGGTSPAG